ncbi:Tyrosine-protein kinase PR2 [Trichinella pseudospiralis]|uniref:non-specific protein-tyrosine kinase n=1 Tax=Trichinella pseudospiralis TaxID=6337 RepID=A0A0V1FGC0_TRIPS|nr:Tyrosine-protein kinase PR2 [Trichinella pseudospiralis]
MRDQVKKSGTQSMSLCDLLKEADLGNYLSALQLQLKVLHAEHLRFVTETDLADIGMSKPEQRRLLKTFQKHFPDSYFSKLRQKLLGKVLPLPIDDDSQTLPKAQPSPSVSSQKTEQHIIPAENIQLCQNLGSGEFASVWRGVWAMSGTGGEKHINDEQVLLSSSNAFISQQGGGVELCTSAQVQVAVKKILPEKMHSNPLDFLQEAAIMHRVNHEHIVRFYGVVLNPKSVMLVTELAPLRSLVECLRQPAFRPSFTVPRLCDYIEQICAGMAYLEANRLIHRDLAARNILVFSLELVKVADFGLSRALGAGEEYYHSNVSVNLKLPIAWCAPECITYLKFTSASDVWSFGVTMWELFTYGFQPWAGLTGQQILDCVNTPKSQRLEAPDACPVDHYNLMLQCWEHEPSKRPKFAELLQLLPEIEPDRLCAITEVDDGEPDHLQYKVDTVITVLNKRPSEYPDGYYWKGVLNTGRTGLFLPETTISQLNSECPSLAGSNDKSMSWSSSSLSSCLPTGAVPSLLATGKRRNIGGKQRHQRNGGGIRWPTTAALLSKAARLKEKSSGRILISAPQNDLRHTGHIGSDGTYFGDVAFLNSCSLLSSSQASNVVKEKEGLDEMRGKNWRSNNNNNNNNNNSNINNNANRLGSISSETAYLLNYEMPAAVMDDFKPANFASVDSDAPSLVDEVFEALQEANLGFRLDEDDSLSEGHRPTVDCSSNQESDQELDPDLCSFSETRHLLKRDEEDDDVEAVPVVTCRPSTLRQQGVVAAVKPLSYNDSKMLVDLTNLAVELADKALRVENERLKQIVNDAQHQQNHCSSTTAGRDSPKFTDQNSNGSSPSSAKKWLTDSLRKLSRERDSVEGDIPTFCSRLPPQGEVKLSAESESAYKSMVECVDSECCDDTDTVANGGDVLKTSTASTSLQSESGEPLTVEKAAQQSKEHQDWAEEQLNDAAEEEEETNPLRLLRDGGPELLKRLRSSTGRRTGKILLAQSSNDDCKKKAAAASPPPPVPPRLHRNGIGGSGQSLDEESGKIVSKKPIPPPVPPKNVSCKAIVRAMRDQFENNRTKFTLPSVDVMSQSVVLPSKVSSTTNKKLSFTMESVDKYELLNFVLSALPAEHRSMKSTSN